MWRSGWKAFCEKSSANATTLLSIELELLEDQKEGEHLRGWVGEAEKMPAQRWYVRLRQGPVHIGPCRTQGVKLYSTCNKISLEDLGKKGFDLHFKRSLKG